MRTRAGCAAHDELSARLPGMPKRLDVPHDVGVRLRRHGTRHNLPGARHGGSLPPCLPACLPLSLTRALSPLFPLVLTLSCLHTCACRRGRAPCARVSATQAATPRATSRKICERTHLRQTFPRSGANRRRCHGVATERHAALPKSRAKPVCDNPGKRRRLGQDRHSPTGRHQRQAPKGTGRAQRAEM